MANAFCSFERVRKNTAKTTAVCAKMYAMSFGILGFAAFINPDTGSMFGVLIAVIATIATSLVAFLLTYFTFKPEDDVVDASSKELVQSETVVSPLNGQLKPIENASDVTFASKALGNGVLIIPEDGQVLSPTDGIVETVFPSGHAIGVVTDTGIEVLIHIGIDTVELDGQGFKVLVEKGQTVVQGQPLLEADLDLIKEAGYSTETVMTITNTDHFLDVICQQEGIIKAGDRVLTVIPFNNQTELVSLEGAL